MPSSRASSLTAPARDAQLARRAVSAVFFINGASFSAILPRYPEMLDAIGLSNTAFGLAVGLGPIGGLLAGLFAAPLMTKWGSARAAVTAQAIASACHLLVYTAQSWLWLAGALMLAVAADAITDIAMNAHGMRVERRYRRSIMNSYHGWWSLGAVSGGLIGAGAAQIGMPLWLQGVITFAVFAPAVLFSHRFMLTGPDTTERHQASTSASSHSSSSEASAHTEGVHDAPENAIAGASPASANDVPVPSARSIAGITPAAMGMMLILGVLLVFAGSVEDAGNTWGALFMNATFTVTPFLAGMAFVALQGAQTIGRFLGDSIVDRLGDRTTARLGAVLVGVGMSVALLYPTVPTALLGFAMSGFGVATLFPAAFRAADDMPGVPPGVGITVVGWLARVGFLISPPLVGALADALTLRYALWVMPVYALGIMVTAGALVPQKTPAGEQGSEST